VETLSYFEHHLKKKMEAEVSEFSENDLIELLVKDIGLRYSEMK
jgi:hypothetical protein